MKDIDLIRRDNMNSLEKEAGSATAAADRLGWSQPQWSNLRIGATDSKTKRQRGMHKDTARKIEEAFGKPDFWLDVDHTEAEIIDLEAHPDLAPVKRVHIELHAGIDGYSIEMVEEEGAPIFFRRDWLKSRGLQSKRLAAIRVKGNSMEHGLHDGDLVVINEIDIEPKDGEVFAVNYEGEAVIKRLRRNAGQWWLASDNSDQNRYAPKICTEDTMIIGRVVYKQSEVI